MSSNETLLTKVGLYKNIIETILQELYAKFGCEAGEEKSDSRSRAVVTLESFEFVKDIEALAVGFVKRLYLQDDGKSYSDGIKLTSEHCSFFD